MTKTEIELKLKTLAAKKDERSRLEGNKETLLKDMTTKFGVSTGKELAQKIESLKTDKDKASEEFAKGCEDYRTLEESMGL